MAYLLSTEDLVISVWQLVMSALLINNYDTCGKLVIYIYIYIYIYICILMHLGTCCTSCARVHELLQIHCGDNPEGTLLS